MKRLCAAVMIAVLGTTTAGTASAASADHRHGTLQRHADALLDQGAPGVLVEVDTPRGDVRVRSGHGNVDARTPVPWRAKFRIGSYTKTFVAATVLQLVGEGRLSLEDTVDRWLPGVVDGNGNDGTKITVRQLLQHTSGLPDFVGRMPELFLEDEFQRIRFRTVTPEQMVALAVQQAPNFAPGADWAYSNTGYILAGMIIERVTGHTWQHEVRTRIVEPLGLRDTSLPGTSPYLPRPHAVAYERFREKGLEADPADPRFGEPIDVTTYNPSFGGAAGDMISTTDDGNKFLKALVGGKVLRPAQLAEMTNTLRTPALDPAWPGARYGLGIMWIPNSCGGHWSHGGNIHGFMTRNGVSSDGTRSVMVSINTDSLVPKPDAPTPDKDVTVDLIDHALCGAA
ncbi:serine hydrolase domain-containing protein [Saccharothrix sp. NRRL B-16314]|uniref:serine hydrolase domain-containing protein n=1 Tax=Saccharothrix sp. NRRL B-16314 TaxID=1463825 RepID=UPI0005272307|nr:serine hydrolase domain-containing protein [Saccharothrix sp. NRRL B-16314]